VKFRERFCDLIIKSIDFTNPVHRSTPGIAAVIFQASP
jgi:hypothetical protein